MTESKRAIYNDAELVALGKRLQASWDAEKDAEARDVDDDAGALMESAVLVETIATRRATTVAGLNAKLLALAWLFDDGEPLAAGEEGGNTDLEKTLVHSLLADIAAMPT